MTSPKIARSSEPPPSITSTQPLPGLGSTDRRA